MQKLRPEHGNFLGSRVLGVTNIVKVIIQASYVPFIESCFSGSQKDPWSIMHFNIFLEDLLKHLGDR